MAYKLDIGSDIACFWSQDPEQMHGNDRRRLSQKVRLCTSKQFGGSNTGWNSSNITRGIIGPLPYLRSRDMKVLVAAVGDNDKRPSLYARLCQRGVPAVHQILTQVGRGRGAYILGPMRPQSISKSVFGISETAGR